MLNHWKNRIESTLLVCRNEWPQLLWMTLLNFLLTAGMVLMFSVVNALFLVNVGFQTLPLAFVISAGILVPCFAVYNYIERIASRRKVLIVSFLVYSLLIGLFRYLLTFNPTDSYLLMTLYVFSTCIMLLANFQYWSFANFIFHPRQGKRLFPLLGVGGTTGAILMGFSLNYLIAHLRGSPNLLYLWMIFFILAAFIVFIMYRRLSLRKEYGTSKELDFLTASTEDFRVIQKIPMLRIVAIIIFIMSLISFIVYFQFNRVVAEMYPDQDQFAAFVGNFNGLLNLVVLMYQFIVTARIISYLGIIQTLFVHPLLLFIPVIAGSFLGASPIPGIIAQFVDGLGDRTFSEAAFESMYGAVPDRYREQALSFMKIIIKPVSIGITGLSLYTLIHLFPGEYSIIISLLLPFLFVFWGYSIWNLKGLYIETLFGNFVREEGKEKLASYQAMSNLPDRETLRILRKTLKMGSDKAKKFAIELIGDMNLSILKEELFEFLSCENEILKMETISVLGKLKGSEIYSRLIRIYNQQPVHVKILILENLKQLEPVKFRINIPLMLSEENEPLIKALLLDFSVGKLHHID
jgi:ATP:ADP antiporter, AAA family